MRTLRWLLLVLLLPQLSQADEAVSVKLPECESRLERRSVEPEVLLVRSDCALSLHSLARLLDEGLSGMFPENRITIRSVHLGRLMNYPEWSRALAHAATQSPDWDSRRGRPQKRSENANRRVTQLLNGPAYPNELKPVFARHGLAACIPYAEKVLVFKAKDILSDDHGSVLGINAKDRLPFDAQVWLTLQPIGTDCAHRQ